MADQEGDRAFEAKLDRLFAEAPAFGDADLFTLRVSDRLNRGWSLRDRLIGALGVAGGMIGVFQVAANGLIARAEALGDRSGVALGHALGHVLPVNLALSSLPFAGDVVWMPLVLAAVAVGFVVARAIREI
jgi:hypothetical protein